MNIEKRSPQAAIKFHACLSRPGKFLSENFCQGSSGFVVVEQSLKRLTRQPVHFESVQTTVSPLNVKNNEELTKTAQVELLVRLPYSG